MVSNAIYVSKWFLTNEKQTVIKYHTQISFYYLLSVIIFHSGLLFHNTLKEATFCTK